MGLEMWQIIILIIVACASYVFATNLFRVKTMDTIQDLFEVVLFYSLEKADMLQKSNKKEFDLFTAEKKIKSWRFRYFNFMNELLLDIGWREKGLTPERFTVLNALVCLMLCGVVSLVLPNIFMILYLFVIIFIMNVAIMFSVSRKGARDRLRKTIAAENLICGNISQGLYTAIKVNQDLFEGGAKEAFMNYIYRDENLHYPLAKNIAALNMELGNHSTGFCQRLYIYETEKRPGQQDMFRFIMQRNLREEERLAEADIYYGEMNFSYFVCAAILVVFLIMCMSSMPEVLEIYKLDIGKAIIILFFSLIAIGYVLVQALQSKPFVFMPERL